MIEAFPYTPASWAYGIAAVIFTAFTLQLLLSWKGGLRASVLLCTAITSAVWSICVSAAIAFPIAEFWIVSRAIDAVRLGCWLLFLLLLAESSHRTNPNIIGLREIPRRWLALTLVLTIAALMPYAPPWAVVVADKTFPLAFYAVLGIAIFGLALCEQLYRRTPRDRQWAIKPLIIGLSGMFALDLMLFSGAALFKNLEPGLWAARGMTHALAILFVAVATARNQSWTINLYISRDMIFHSTTAVATGVYLVMVATAAYWVHFYGGEWGATLRVTFIFASVLGLGALIFSGSLRSRLRVFINKNLFSHRYDYRREWLQFTRLLGTSEQGETLYQQVIRSLAGLVESGGGAIWLEHKDQSSHGSRSTSSYGEIASLNLATVNDVEASTSAFLSFLARTGWVINIDEFRTSPQKYPGLELPVWLDSLKGAWLVIPLMNVADLTGFVVVARPRTPIDINWEILDLLKTASRQVASYLALFRANEALIELEKFDAFNRMSAFVVHDLKNLIAQLTLLLKNAERHRDNPEFQTDMLDTIAHVATRMSQLMQQLGAGTTPIEKPRTIELTQIIHRIIKAKTVHNCTITFETVKPVFAIAHEDRIERVIGHIVQNAIEASEPNSGIVSLHVFLQENYAKVEVDDQGVGMTESFIRERLFHPFQTTKAQGMGIGMFESFHYINSIGGRISVDSTPGKGTRFSVLLPSTDYSASAENTPHSKP